MAHNPTAHPEELHGHGVGHVVPPRILFAVGGLLLVLTILTVFTAKFIDLGSGNIWLALVIAMTKASLVCLYFMHLRWDSPFNAVILISSFLGVMLFIGIALTDTGEYQPEIRAYGSSGLPAPSNPLIVADQSEQAE